MPYIRKGKCVYKKNTGKKVGCSSSTAKAKKYLKALHANVEDEEDFNTTYSKIIDKYKT